MSKSYMFAVPILPGQVETWKTFTKEVTSTYKQEFEAARHKAGVLRETHFHQSTPAGDFALVHLELTGSPEKFFAQLASDQDSAFGKYFSQQLKKIHGIDTAHASEIPINEQVMDWHSTNLIEKATETATGIGQNVLETAQILLNKAGENAGGFGQQMAGTASELIKKAQELTQEMRTRAEAQAAEARQTLTATTSTLLDQASQNSAKVSKVVQEKASKFMDEASVNAATVSEKVAETASQLVDQSKTLLSKNQTDAGKSEAEPSDAGKSESKPDSGKTASGKSGADKTASDKGK